MVLSFPCLPNPFLRKKWGSSLLRVYKDDPFYFPPPYGGGGGKDSLFLSMREGREPLSESKIKKCIY
jgi:hypothetical protein